MIALLIELGSGLGPWLASPNSRTQKQKDQDTAAEARRPAAPAADAAAQAAEAKVDDVVSRWAGQAVTRRRGSFVPAAEMRAAFEAWCAAQSIEPLNPTAFGKAMTAAAYDRAKIGGVMRYEDVALVVPAREGLHVAVDNTRRVLGPMASRAS